MTYPKSWSPHFRAKVERDIEAAHVEEARYQQKRQEARDRAIWMQDLMSRPLTPKLLELITAAENDALNCGIGVSLTQLDGYGRILFQRVDAVKDFIGPLEP